MRRMYSDAQAKEQLGQGFIPKHTWVLKIQAAYTSTESFVHNFHLTVCLRVIRSGLKSINLEGRKQVLEHSRKLCTIITSYGLWYTILTYDFIMKKSCYSTRLFIRQRCSYYKLRENVNAHHHYFLTLATFWKSNT